MSFDNLFPGNGFRNRSASLPNGSVLQNNISAIPCHSTPPYHQLSSVLESELLQSPVPFSFDGFEDVLSFPTPFKTYPPLSFNHGATADSLKSLYSFSQEPTLVNSISSSSPSQMESGDWDPPLSPSNTTSAGATEAGLAPEAPLISTNPTPRALKAKRRPTNKCECGGKGNCDNPLCAKSVGCHSCPVCGIEFSRKNSMRRHVLTHINLRPYECRDCNKSFYRSDIYKRHLVSKRCRRNTSQAQLLALCQQQGSTNIKSPLL